MTNSKNRILINGKIYDAHTGLPIDSSGKSLKTTGSPVKGIDGILSPPSSKPKKDLEAAPVSKPDFKTKKQRQPAPKVKATPKRSQTLYRSAVKRPTLKTPQPIQPISRSATVKPKIDQKRIQRAQKINRSDAIERFHKTIPPQAKVQQKLENSDIKPLTAHLRKTHEATDEASSTSQIKSAQRAIEAHRKTQKKSGRFMRYATGTFAALLLGGYVAYLNMPTISMRVAASRAGFAASMPHTPSGYRISGPIAHSPGQVVVNFHSNTDSRKFSVIQQPTNWDSLALLENYVSKHSTNHETYQDRGLTIYTYQGGDAAWVNNGKMYAIHGQDARLGINQILEIAASM